MTRRAARPAALLAPLLLLAPGCGTLLTHEHGQDARPFSGCQADLLVMSAPFLLAVASPSCLTGVPFCLAAGLIDLPLSFVGDLCVLVGRAAREDEPGPAPSPTAPAEVTPASREAPAEVALAHREPPSLTLEAAPSDPR